VRFPGTSLFSKLVFLVTVPSVDVPYVVRLFEKPNAAGLRNMQFHACCKISVPKAGYLPCVGRRMIYL
jgi:hypothetical protein